jgi:hypothetical protein
MKQEGDFITEIDPAQSNACHTMYTSIHRLHAESTGNEALFNVVVVITVRPRGIVVVVDASRPASTPPIPDTSVV